LDVHSGNEQIFLQAWDADFLLVSALKSKLLDFDGNYSTSPAELETRIVDVHAMGSEANGIKAK
jgi:hypothetical protein